MSRRTEVYRSKRDGWLTAVMAVSLLMLLGAAVMCFPAPLWSTRIAGVFSLATVIFVGWMFLRTQYEIEDDLLIVRAGPLRWRIRIGDIRSLKRTNDPTSGPALSLDRISVIHERNGERDEILISPADAAGFIAAVRSRNAAVVVDS